MSKQPVEVRLIVLTGNRVGEEIVVVDEAILGRLAACDLHIEDKLASRRHAKVRVGPDGVYLEDLGSSNGTRLHDERIREARLEDGDEFEIGHTRIRVRLESTHVDPAPEAAAYPGTAAGAGFEEIQLEGLEEETAPAAQAPEPSTPPRARAAAPSPAKGMPAKGMRGKGGALHSHRGGDRGGLRCAEHWQRSGLSRIPVLALVLAVGAALFLLAYHSVS